MVFTDIYSVRNTNRINFIFVFAALIVAGCSRSVDQASHVVIQMPGSPASASASGSYVSNLLSYARGASVFALSTQDTTWAEVTPTGYSDKYNLNCFFVLVSAPDLNQYSCHKITNSFTGDSVDDVVLRYGVIAGAATLGSDLYLKVDAGIDRVFTIYGMHTDSNLACTYFYTGLFSRASMTKPYFLGASAPTQLNSGVDSVVNIKMQSYDPEKYLDYCDSESVLNVHPAPVAVGALEARIDTGVFGGDADFSACIPIDVGYKDTTGLQNVLNTYTGNVTMNATTTPGPTTTALPSYKLAYDCMNNLNVETSFTFPNLYQVRRYVKASAIQGLDNITINESPSPIANFKLFAKMNTVTSVAHGTIAASVPEVIRNGVCYPVTVTNNSTDWAGFNSFTASGTLTIAVSYPSGEGQSAAFYSSTDCSSGVLSFNTFSSGYTAAGPFLKAYAKFNGLSEGDKVKYTISTSVPAVYGNFYSLAKGNSGNSDGVKLKIQGPTEFLLATAACYGPFRLSAVDQFGAEVTSSSRTVQLSISKDELAVFPSGTGTPCTGTNVVTMSAPRNVTLASAQTFYVKLYNNAAYSLTQYVFVTDSSVSGKLAPTNIQLNMTNPIAAAPTERIAPQLDLSGCTLCIKP